MNSRKLFLILASFVFALTSALAQTVQTQATVSRVTGTATVTLTDGSTVPLSAGMKLPQGSTITTGADGDVYLETHQGYMSAIKKDSAVTIDEVSVVSENGQVKEERTMLDLKSGNLVANLDPKKKALNNFQVRTPKGVAAARGTTFTVQYKGETITIAVVNGAVTIAGAAGYRGPVAAFGAVVNAVEVAAGSMLQTAQALDGIGAAPAAQFVANMASGTQEISNDLRELLAVAVATVAVAAQNGIGGTTAADAAAVAQAVFAAAPSVAAQAAAIMSTSGVSTGAVADAVRATVPPAQQAAFQSSLQTGTFQQTQVNVETRTTTTVTQEATPIVPIDVSVVSPSGGQN